MTVTGKKIRDEPNNNELQKAPPPSKVTSADENATDFDHATHGFSLGNIGTQEALSDTSSKSGTEVERELMYTMDNAGEDAGYDEPLGSATIWRRMSIIQVSVVEEKTISKRAILPDWCNQFLKLICQFCQTTAVTIRNHPLILVWTLTTFIALCSIGISITIIFDQQDEDTHRQGARQLAIQTGKVFSDQLDRATLPLFSLAQFVYELDFFQDLPRKIGEAGISGALPFLPPKEVGGVATHRNVTGVCDEPQLVSRYNKIASTIKRNAGMNGILVNLQLQPAAVLCLLYPVNNTEDFPPGIFLDNSRALGHDLLHDPSRKFIVEKTLRGSRIVTVGPLKLVQCNGCNTIVEKALIVRLPIAIDGFNITVDGEVFQSWGLATALINWEALVNRSLIYEQFLKNGLEFLLTRTDNVLNATTGEYYLQDVVLAKSLNANSVSKRNTETVDLETTDNLWRITVGSVKGFHGINLPLIIAGVVAFSLIISLMLLLILVEKHNHGDLLKEILPPRVLRKIQRGETVVEQYDMITVFFSDIIGYTSMSAEMHPVAVMEMLNKFYSLMDELADKHKVYKVETIGDAYMVTAGCPEHCTALDGAERVAMFAIDVLAMVREFRAPNGTRLFVRVGINSGPVVAGVVGTKRPHYTVFGDTVNAAARMESTSTKMKIQCTESTFRLLDSSRFAFDLRPRGIINVKGKGDMDTWWIEGLLEEDRFDMVLNDHERVMADMEEEV